MFERELSIIEPDNDIFEINDFTVVTKLECLIISLENILQNSKNWPTEAEKTNKTDRVKLIILNTIF